ncbi:MAG: flagellar hook protein FlgE [Acidobacteria bacterium]|nr:flagellar hook protein FlgE [Acidobacteriota bacterium]
MLIDAFYSGLSGLKVNSQGLNVIGENLANVNTVGFKKGTTQFAEILNGFSSGHSGSGNPLQQGMGAQLRQTSSSFLQGSILSTGLKSNVAIEGTGFFVMSNGSQMTYSRAGNFTFDEDGYIVSPSGLHLMGYRTDPNGVINISSGLQSLQVSKGVTSAPQQTDLVRFFSNVTSDAQPGDSYTTSVEIFDSLGISHNLQLQLTKNPTIGEWAYQFVFPDGTVSNTAPTQGDGTITFDGAGNLILLDGLSIQDPSIANRTIGLNNLLSGANDMVFTWDLIDILPGQPNVGRISNYGNFSVTGSLFQNGYGSGKLQDINIDTDGRVYGLYDNGQILSVGQMALATFTNDHGLRKAADNQFFATIASGAASVDIPGSGGRGHVLSSSLESSNVDISEEFTNMIISQRGYQSNSKIITTVDSLLSEALTLKR